MTGPASDWQRIGVIEATTGLHRTLIYRLETKGVLTSRPSPHGRLYSLQQIAELERAGKLPGRPAVEGPE